MSRAGRKGVRATGATMLPGNRPGAPRAGGFTYVAMLFALAIFGVGLAALGESWSAASHREKEEELIRVGGEFVKAIASYHQRSPGTPKAYPASLDELLLDNRFVGTERHLRTIYRDPFTNNVAWELVRTQDGRIMGVHSRSNRESLRKRPFQLAHSAMIGGARYSDWKFVFIAVK